MIARHLILAALALATAAGAQTAPPDGPPGGMRQQVFIAPSGKPYRADANAPYPVAAWVADVDRNHDGQISRTEFIADFDRFFDELDVNHDGVISTDEVSRYERVVAPEVAAWTGGDGGGFGGRRGGRGRGGGRGGHGGGDGPGDGDDFGGSRPGRALPYEATPAGAGRYGLINSPEPVAGMDVDLDGAISRGEERAAAGRRFDLLDPVHRGTLDVAALPKTVVQIAAEKRAAKEAKDTRRR